MKTEKQYFDEAISIQDYMDSMTTHKDNSFKVYNNYQLPEDGEFISLLASKKPHILTITEDWCGDAMMNNPIIRKIAEAANLEMRCVYRDQNLELMDQYLTNGGRSIPVYIILSEAGEVLGKWGPRAPQLQEYVLAKKATLPTQDDPTFEEKQKELFASITEENASNEEFWSWVYDDFRKVVTNTLK
ncbi:thioredoxin family protein [Viridibacillus arvi]|uniref:thioredoxin family protein n=1 Tax=Viridibacillus arvi TaxID=263475 RepID=UPI003D275DE8